MVPLRAPLSWLGLRLPWLAGLAVLLFVQIVGTFGASHIHGSFRGLDALAIILVALGPVALVFAVRWPVPVLWFIAAVTLTYLLRGYPYGPVVFALVAAVVVVVMRGHRWSAWLALAALIALHFGLRGPLVGTAMSWLQLVAVAAWALLVLVIAEFARTRRERLLAARRVRAETERRQAGEERLRLAQELHDVVAHHMSLINVQAGVALHVVDRHPEQAQTALAAIKDASKTALTEMRWLVDTLRDESEAAPRGPASTLSALDELAERSRHTGLAVEVTRTGSPRELSAGVELAAFRIVQESLTNVVRHAGAHRAQVRLDYRDDVLSVQVDDDGRGFDPAAVSGDGSGLRGMRERARALGGQLDIQRSPSGGTRVSATLPLDGDA